MLQADINAIKDPGVLMEHVSFRTDGRITAIVSIAVKPWNSFNNPIVVGYSLGSLGALLGPFFVRARSSRAAEVARFVTRVSGLTSRSTVPPPAPPPPAPRWRGRR